MMGETDSAPLTASSRQRRLPGWVVDRIEARLRRHFSVPAAAALCEALQGGDVVRADLRAPGVIAYRHGILFVAGTEYVICDD